MRAGGRAPWSVVVLALVLTPCLLAEGVDLALGVDPETLGPTLRAPPSAAHPLGTDALGRDHLSRLLHGGRVSLAVATLGALLAFAVGAGLGLTAGWVGGRVEAALMRLTEATLAVPKLPLLLVLAGLDVPAAAGLRAGPASEILALGGLIGAFAWPDVARLTRAATRSLRHRDFVRAAEGLGLGPVTILRVHVLPHLAAPLGVAFALELGQNVLYESTLSFLGLGLSAPTPSWGRLLARAFARLSAEPWMAVVPGLLTLAVVASLHDLAERLRAAGDPGATPSTSSARAVRGLGAAPERAEPPPTC
jgi:peptide/nickel transport system permease protein